MLRVVMWAAPLLLAMPAVAGNAPETAAGDAGEIICKRFTRTGSLVAREKTCKTRAEWQRDRDALRVMAASDSCRLRAEPDPYSAGGGCS